MNDKNKVLGIYPNAYCKFFESRKEFRVYYNWNTKSGTTVHAMLGCGKSKAEAWNVAFEAIQRLLLIKFEYGIEAG